MFSKTFRKKLDDFIFSLKTLEIIGLVTNNTTPILTTFQNFHVEFSCEFPKNFIPRSVAIVLQDNAA